MAKYTIKKPISGNRSVCERLQPLQPTHCLLPTNIWNTHRDTQRKRDKRNRRRFECVTVNVDAVNCNSTFAFLLTMAQYAPAHEQINFYYSKWNSEMKVSRFICCRMALSPPRAKLLLLLLLLSYIYSRYCYVRRSYINRTECFARFESKIPTCKWHRVDIHTARMGRLALESNWKRRNNWNYTRTFSSKTSTVLSENFQELCDISATDPTKEEEKKRKRIKRRK